MKQKMRTVLIFLVWFLGAGSCLVWGSQRVWVAGLGIAAMSLATIAFAYLPDTDQRDKQRYSVAGAVMLIVGVGLLYIGLFRDKP